jgi:hypothetical protein
MNKETFFGQQATAISKTDAKQEDKVPSQKRETSSSKSMDNDTKQNQVINSEIKEKELPGTIVSSQPFSAPNAKQLINHKETSGPVASLTSRNQKENSALKPLENKKEKTANMASVPNEDEPNEKEKQAVTDNGGTEPAETVVEKKESKTDTALAESTPATTKDSTVSKADTTNTLKIAGSKKDSKWQWRVHAAGGVSGIAASTFKFLPVASSGVNSNAQALFDRSFSFSAVNGPANAVVQHKPEVYSGFSFSAGADVKKNISGRLAVTAGLNYSYFSTRVYIGSKVNTATTLNRVNEQVKVNDYFLASGVTREPYTNEYHFIELPLGIDWKIFKKKPLHWHSGVTVSRLLATNALYYSNQQNIYYEDDDVFKKTQFSLFTDLSYRLIKFKKGSLHAGPQVQLGLSNLLKKEDYGRQHLFFAGLNTHFEF